ncbi:hypothetical protein [Halobacterium rubrum]|uniref:hypothetical protein n=1 Tax=Halobacterium TaxID=2239 RepID=UPI001F236371|nr:MULTISPECIES: hypothetical protein [Halobacterium]MDH5020380.1 hypothetical protein [Halobacterium rubrum]
MSYRIRPATDSRFGPARVQFVECDPDIQSQAGLDIGPADIERKLKALCLLNDVVAIGATHVLKSPETYTALKRNPLLITDGPIVFTMGRSHNSFEEALHNKLSKPERHNPLWTSKNPEIQRQSHRLEQRARFLEEHADLVMTRDISDMRTGFSNGLTTELADEDSPLYQRLRTRGEDPTSLKERIEEISHSSRRFIHKQGSNLPNEVYRTLKKHADVNYHLTGSTYHHAATTLHPLEIASLEGIFDELVTVHADDELVASMSRSMQGDVGNSSTPLVGPKVPHVNDALAVRMFSDITGGIRQDIGELDASIILDLREESATQNLREELMLIADNIHRDNVELTDLDSLQKAQREFETALEAEYLEERRREAWADRALDNPFSMAPSIGMNILGSYLLSSDTAFVTGTAVTAAQWTLGRYLPEMVETDLLDFERRYMELVEQGDS